MTVEQLDAEFEAAGAELARFAWSDRIYWPLAGGGFYLKAKAEADAKAHAQIRDWLKP